MWHLISLEILVLQMVRETIMALLLVEREGHTLLSSSSFAIAGALVGLCSLAAIAMVSLSKRIYRVDNEGPSIEVGVAQVINGHLITMNSIHTSAIDFMKAMEAVSNHNNIFLKTRFCTYYKAMMPNGSSYSVKKLNWSDKIFQIGSQEKFGHELEVGNLSNSNAMVPLAYVSTKDNAYLLYEHMYNGTVFDLLHDGRSDVLDWTSRNSIGLGGGPRTDLSSWVHSASSASRSVIKDYPLEVNE